MSTASAQAKLTDAMRVLKAQSTSSLQKWKDPVADRFAKDVIEPIEPTVRQTLSAMAELDNLLMMVRKLSRQERP
jgi:hypothetical protein